MADVKTIISEIESWFADHFKDGGALSNNVAVFNRGVVAVDDLKARVTKLVDPDAEELPALPTSGTQAPEALHEAGESLPQSDQNLT